jgi:DNA-binding MarR family transcriptional regulator
MELICKLKDLYKTFYAYEKQFSEQTGITINEGALLCCLKEGKPRSANELCEYIRLSGSRVSRIINSMESKGFILREMGTTDKRQMIFTLTDSGRQKIEAMKNYPIDMMSLVAQVNKIAGL